MEQTLKKHKRRHRFSLSTGSRRNRKTYGDIMMLLIIALMALFSFLPLLMSVCMSLKPINELFYYPPRIFPERPTLDNFRMLFNLMKTTWVPFERYAFNTIFITLATTIGHVVLASMAAYPMAKMKIPFVRLFNNLILLSLMFVSAINDIANYLTITWLGWLDTYFAVIIPSIGVPLGVFIMKNYMSTIPDTLLEAARIDGCSESGIYWRIVMPLAKPVWLTVVILMFQQIWSQNNSQYVYSEQLKTLPYALTQITSGGMVRMGAAQAVGVLMLLVPAVVFMFSQTRIIDTMATSGMKE